MSFLLYTINSTKNMPKCIKFIHFNILVLKLKNFNSCYLIFNKSLILSIPKISAHVKKEVMDTPKIPWRLRFCPVNKRLGMGVRGVNIVNINF